MRFQPTLLVLLTVLLSLRSAAQSNATLVTSYTMEACGLNYTQASVRLNQRSFAFNPPTGATQPATLVLGNLPVCAVVLKAFLYAGTSGNGATFTASLTNPQQQSAAVPMTVIGADVDICWSFPGTYAYRADVTPLVTGNGSYILSGLPTSSVVTASGSDTDGATLFVVYQDPAQGYTGGIVLADGCKATPNNSPVYSSVTVSGFSVCGTPTLTEHFMVLADLQQLGNTLIGFNAPGSSSAAINYNKAFNTDKVWDFVSGQVSAFTAGQTSAIYGNYNLGGDCLAMILAGGYYRSGCLQCQAASGVASPTIALTSTSVVACAADVTVNVSGGLAPYSYTWTGGVSTTSVASGLPSGQYDIAVSGLAGCGSGTISIELITDAPPAVVNHPSVCPNQTVAVYAAGGTAYTWVGPGGFSSVQQNITVTGSSQAGVSAYSVTVYGSNSCSSAAVALVTTLANPTLVAAASKTLICPGESSTLTPGGAQTYSWLPAGLGTGPLAIVVTPTASTAYTLQGNSASGCFGKTSVTVEVGECTGIVEQQTTLGFAVYPNPATDAITITATRKMDMIVVDGQGCCVRRIGIPESHAAVRLEGLLPGIYYLVEVGKAGGSKVIITH